MTYRVVYHEGESMELLTPSRVGRLSLKDGFLRIEGEWSIAILQTEMRSVELVRIHASRVIKIQHTGGILMVVTIRFMFLGIAVGNYLATGRLYGELHEIIAAQPSHSPGLRS